MTLARYIARLLAARLVISLLAISALLQLFDLFNNARSLLSRGGTTSDLVVYAGLRLPTTVEQALPIAMLIAALAAFLSLSRSNEMIALRGAGMTIYRILLLCAPVAMLSSAAHYLLLDAVTPLSERRFADWWHGFTAGGAPEREEGAIWLRSGDAFVRVGDIAASGQALNDIQIVYLSQQGVLTRWVEAEQARHTPEGWVLYDVRTTTVENGRIILKQEDNFRWPAILDAASIVELDAQPESLSTAQLRRILSGTSAGESSPSYYLTQLHRSYAVPLASPLMVVLAAPAGYAIRRRGHTGRGLALGFGLGMAYLVTDGLLSALGSAGALPAALAVWVAPALFAVIGASTLLHYEE